MEVRLKPCKTFGNIFLWPSMASHVKEYIANCSTCKEIKHPRQVLRPPIGNEVVTQRPFQKIYIDFMGPYPRTKTGKSFIFIVLDHKTKFVLLKTVAKATVAHVNKFLIEEIFYKFGVPEFIHSDDGKPFTSQAFKDLLQIFGIRHIRTAIHSPQSNASERVNQTILSSIRSYLKTDQSKWDEKLPKNRIRFKIYNTCFHWHITLFRLNRV